MATPSPVSCAICNMLVSDSNEQRHVQTHHSTPPDLRRPSECFPSLNWIDCPAPGCVCSMRKGDPLMAHYIESHPVHANENLTTFFPSAVCCDCGHWSFNRVCAKRHRSMKHRDAITHPPKVTSPPCTTPSTAASETSHASTEARTREASSAAVDRSSSPSIVQTRSPRRTHLARVAQWQPHPKKRKSSKSTQ
ncbi:uncharacterized protein MONBRDRAFT_9718 [Monosiga brevicollis MX1]|uniref:Uncharacterized protein n=1 Tax=Monosiga brevicollis TaxID=81824 RepID=A9V3K3_MONBE|nr:uncharacterized protein MONBRDRAFT_9718 [Monosiga brevicollis MX1]EDQ87828.1 predicted protein [Monosiga brevicollis MX1]|eukprot:XP_001747361.1 hypothetical protein [Monosiga brevicollis MX1]